MNNTFNMQRFLWLFSKHTKENYKTYLMSLGVVAGILFISLGYVAYFEGLGNGIQEAFFAVFLVFSGSVFASLAFSNLGHKNNAISILTLPVSTFERFLVSWIYSFVIFQIAFVACFYAVDIAIINISNHNSTTKTEVFDIISADSRMYIVFLCFWLLHGVSFLGSVFFQKLHFIKTALVFFLVLTILVFANQALARLIMDHHVSVRMPLSNLFIKEGTSMYYIDTHASMPLILTIMLSVGALCLWAAAYFKLKEKQV